MSLNLVIVAAAIAAGHAVEARVAAEIEPDIIDIGGGGTGGGGGANNLFSLLGFVVSLINSEILFLICCS